MVRQLAGFLVVAGTMVEMFTIPKSYFVLGSIVSTISMACVAILLSPASEIFRKRPQAKTLALGFFLAIVLYFIFYAGNFAIKNFSIGGIQASNELGIYGLFTNTNPALLLLVFALDAVGFESYFRGNLQQGIAKRIGIAAVPLVAVIDAAIHLSTFNPLFPATVIVADIVWGLNYYISKDIYSNIASHFLWDLLIFVLFPIH